MNDIKTRAEWLLCNVFKQHDYHPDAIWWHKNGTTRLDICVRCGKFKDGLPTATSVNDSLWTPTKF